MQQIAPRDFDADFSKVPRHWMANNAVGTAISNGVNMLFPAGERFFVRSVKHFLPRITDATLRAQIKGFFGQEGRHARAHDEFNQIMRLQGFEIDKFLGRFEAILKWMEHRISPELRLAATAAAEHYTAIMAQGAFTQDALDQCAPEMRALLAWHAAEEIEHKAVAYDVLQAVDPSYRTRVLGLAYATLALTSFWIAGTAMLIRQEHLVLGDVLAQLRLMQREDPIFRRVFLRGIKSYLRRDFHPSQTDDYQLAAQWMAARGMTLPEAA